MANSDIALVVSTLMRELTAIDRRPFGARGMANPKIVTAARCRAPVANLPWPANCRGVPLPWLYCRTALAPCPRPRSGVPDKTEPLRKAYRTHRPGPGDRFPSINRVQGRQAPFGDASVPVLPAVQALPGPGLDVPWGIPGPLPTLIRLSQGLGCRRIPVSVIVRCSRPGSR